MAPAEPPRRGGSRRARAIALTSAGVVLATAIVAGAVALGRDRGEAAPSTSPPAAGTSAPGSEQPSPSAATDPGVVVDHLNGVTFPVLDGWAAPDSFSEDDAVLITPGTYDCPGDPGLCRHGRVLSRTAAIGEDPSPQALAEGDIEAAAKSQFDRDGVGNRPHGGITSHHVVKTGQVAVAGRAGYFVRWRVITAKGPGGYVQSLAFPPARAPRHRSSSASPSTRAPTGPRSPTWTGSPRESGPSGTRRPAGSGQQHRPLALTSGRTPRGVTGRYGPRRDTSARSPSPGRPRPGAAPRNARTTRPPWRAGTTPCPR